MLPRADIITVSPVGRAQAVTSLEGVGDARQEAFQRSLAGLLGKSLQGEVLSKLTDGSFIVRVAGASARMLLPPGAQVGSQVPLTLVAVNPRPTFEIGSGQAARAYSEAGPALLPGPAGAAARAAPLVYLEGGTGPAPAGQPAAAAAGTARPLAEAGPPGASLRGAALPATALPATALPAAAQAGAAGPLAAAAGADPAAARPASLAAALLEKAPLIPADQLPALDPKSAPASLSDAAKVIASVLTTALKTENPPTAIIARTPLVAAPMVQPEHLAAALKDAIGKSGLFYESHVAEWADGKRSSAELAQEPQMQRAAAPEGGPRPQSPAADPATAQFINLQLLAGEQGRVAWLGQVWPGQQMQWEIDKDAPDSRGSEGEAAGPGWRSGLRLRFPLLGDIGATVTLAGGQLRIALEAGSGEVGGLLRGHAGTLAAALEAAGTPLSSLTVRDAAGDRDG